MSISKPTSTARKERRKIRPSTRPRPATTWMWILGFLTLAAGAILFPAGLMSYLTPFIGEGPSETATLTILARILSLLPNDWLPHLTKVFEAGAATATAAPIPVRLLGILAFLVHCVAVLCMGIAGVIIIHRAWHPGVVWMPRENDPDWLKRWIERYNWLSHRVIKLAWRGTYLSALLCALGFGYMYLGETFRLTFEIEPDLIVVPDIYHLVFWQWPLLLLALSNIYDVKRHFVNEDVEVEHLVRPADVIDLMDQNDQQKVVEETEAEAAVKTITTGDVVLFIGRLFLAAVLGAIAGLAIWLVIDFGMSLFTGETGDSKSLTWWMIVGAVLLAINVIPGAEIWRVRILKFCLLRTAFLRHRTVEIGQTDVHSRWWSQQFLRGYRWGDDHRFSESNAWSFGIHAAVIFGPIILAFLLGFLGCIDPYKIPHGGGDKPKGPQKKEKKTKVKKIKKKYLVNPYSSIVFAAIDPKQIDLKLEQDTDNPWTGVRGRGRAGGRGGAGKPGYGGGLGGGVVRFIRLRHGGSDWNRNMKLSGDTQMLIEFHKRTEIPVAAKTESVTAEQLQKFPKKFTPPFIYVTGRKYFSIGSREARILRDYLLKRGGLIIGDSPGESFSSSFRSMISRVLGSQARWIDIPDDDEMYTCYYVLDRGAPPLWHHDGNRAMGIKHEGRWVVFYHPGDLGDAWKIGHSGASPDAVEAAYQMGVNMMHYSFTHYIDFHKGKF